MDSVHGYITVPNCFVDNLIDTEYFQRLRNIDQTGVRIVYPSVKHDRFSHSIGVFHLGQKAVESLINSIYENKLYENRDKEEIERNKILFLIACLLHDIGHTPFSHSLESQILAKSKIKQNEKELTISESLAMKIQCLEKEKDENDEKTFIENIKKVAAHEQMGSHLIFEPYFKEKIRLVFEEYKKISSINFQNIEDESILNDDLAFITRMIMGIKYKNYKKERQIRNSFVELLNGENFDVDKLDYIIRDTQMAGISNIDVDVERLITSVSINVSTIHLNKVIESEKKLKDTTIINIKNNLPEDKISFSGEFKGKIIIQPNSDVIIKKDSMFSFLKGEITFSGNNCGEFDEMTTATADGKKLQLERSTENGPMRLYIRGNQTGKQPIYEICNAKAMSDFIFKTSSVVELKMHNQCSIEIKGSFYSEGAISVFNNGVCKGNVSEIEILGNSFDEGLSSSDQINENNYKTYHISFKKQAINVIANVLKARNYLYLWIYAHHKVVYYANFLIPLITSEIYSKELKKDVFPDWDLSYDNIKHLDDCYIWTTIRYLLYLNKKQNNLNVGAEVVDLMEELLNRKYKKSLYKSLVEFDLFFESFSESSLERLIKCIPNLIAVDKARLIKDGECQIGYFKKEELSKIEQKAEGKIKIDDLIYVAVKYKNKELQPLNVYINMDNKNIIPISRIPLLDVNETAHKKQQKKNYFYLYYKTEKELENTELINLKKAVKEYLKELVKN